MSDLSGKTVAELKEIAREREVATRTEINRARKATLLEWLETPEPEAVEVPAPEVEEENEQRQGELFPSPPEVETVNETVEPKSEPEKALPEEPPVQPSFEEPEQKEGAWDTMTLVLVGLAVVALLIYLFR